MTEFLQTFAHELLSIFLDASAYILFGFGVAACIQVLLPMHTVHRLLGKGRVRPIFMASLLGIPLPLCSCAVLPTGLALRRRGASPGATASFLISTPESDVDAIVLTWGLLGPVMAIYRPIAGFVTAIAAGFAADRFVRDDDGTVLPDREAEAAENAARAAARAAAPSQAAGPSHVHDKLSEEEPAPAAAPPLAARLRAGFVPAFKELFDETSHWIFTGLIISALITTLLPTEVITRYLGSGAVPLFVMLFIGIPLYICASASTPIAAALVMKGLSPGAALVFLLAGPATNIGAIAILGRAFGRRFLAVYVGSIAVFSLIFGYLLDVTLERMNWKLAPTLGAAADLPSWLAWPSMLALLVLLAASFRRVAPPKEFRDLGRGITRLLGFELTGGRAARLAGAAAAAALLASCLVVVHPGQQGLVRRFGAPVGAPREEGLHLKLPFPIERAQLVHSAAVRRIEIGFRTPQAAEESTWLSPEGQSRGFDDEALYLTGDENIVDAKASVQIRIVDPARYLWGFRDPEETIQTLAISELLDVLASRSIDRFYTDARREVERLVTEGLRRRIEAIDLGVEVVHVGILSVHAPPEVHAAFRDVASAQEDKQREVDIAFRYLDETVNLARGEAAARVEAAHGAGTSAVLRAEGDSRSLTERIAAYRARPSGTRTRLYLETVEEVLSRATKIVQPGWGGSGSVDLWISGKNGANVPVTDVISRQQGSGTRAAPNQGEE